MRNCLQCGEPLFDDQRPDALYCLPKCKLKAQRLRKKAKSQTAPIIGRSITLKPAPMPRRWFCQSCKRSWATRIRPEHEHPLVRLCAFEECSTVIAEPGKGSGNPRACSEEHALLAIRRARGLVEVPPRVVGTGQWFFFERQRLGLTRATLQYHLDAHSSLIWSYEVNNQKLPPNWTALLQTPGLSQKWLHDNWPRKRASRTPASPPNGESEKYGGPMAAEEDRLIQIFREMNRVQGELVAETRRHSEQVRAHGRRFAELEANTQMLMGVAFAVTGERVAAERNMANALLIDPRVAIDFASYWPESRSALESARTWITTNQRPADRQPQTSSASREEDFSTQMLALLRRAAALRNIDTDD